MAEEIRQKVNLLLQPTHDIEAWHAEVASLNKEEAIPVLLAILNDSRQALRMQSQAVTLLGELHDPRAVEPLIVTTANASDGLLRAKSALALGKLEFKEARVIQALIRGLEDSDDFVRECCAKVLGLMRIPEAVVPLDRMSAVDSVSTNREAAQEASKSIRGVA